MNWKRVTIATLLLSFGMLASASAQDDRREHERDEHRVYDRYHHDYHNWGPEEDGYYRQWYGNTYHTREYREYGRINRRDQRRYWDWRHQQHVEHEEHEHDR